MAQAWQKREMERQELLRAQMGRVYEEMQRDDGGRETPGDVFAFELLALILEFLGSVHRDLEGSVSLAVSAVSSASKVWEEEMLPAFRTFARSDSELHALVATLAEKHLLPTISIDLYSKLRQDEFMRPALIFKAESATEEVSLFSDE